MLLKLSLLSLILKLVATEPPYPFCQACFCSNNKDGLTDVTCEINIGQAIFESTMWQNATGYPWPYKNFILHNTPLLTIEDKFPMSNITYLDMSQNSIVNISDEVFQNLQSMITLILSNNNIEMIHPNAFQGLYQEGSFQPLKSLKNLHLDYNRIESLHQDLFEHTANLEKLTLSHNPIKAIDQQTTIAITSLVFLKHLDLSYTQLKDLPSTFLHTPKYLDFLDLSGNSFDKIPFTLEHTQKLTILYFNDNPIVNLTSENGFPNMSSLISLHISNMTVLKRITKGALSNLDHLEELYCSYNPDLSYIDSHALSQSHSEPGDTESQTWPPLKKLHLQSNKLASIDMGFILRWQALIELDLTDNVWTCECENQWLMDELMPIYLEIDEYKAKQLRCAAPIEMLPFTFYDLYQKESQMRCLDRYGNRPERDGALLVGILAGVLITIPFILFIIYAYQRHWFGIFDSSPAAYSRQFYNRGNADDGVL